MNSKESSGTDSPIVAELVQWVVLRDKWEKEASSSLTGRARRQGLF